MLYILVLVLAIFWSIILHNSRFCTLGAITDILNFASYKRLQMFILSISVAIIATQSLLYFGLINYSHSPYANNGSISWAAHVIGGLIFGTGMLLCSGCPTKQCTLTGGGNIKSLMILIIIAISAQISLSGILAEFRAFLQNSPLLTIKSMYIKNIDYKIGIIIGVFLFLFTVILMFKNNKECKPIIYSILIGLIVAVMWYIAGNLAFIEQDESTLDYAYLYNSSRNIQTLSMLLPLASLFDWLMYASDSMRILNLNTMLILGLIIGSSFIALFNKFKFKNSTNNKNKPQVYNDIIESIIGAIFIGFGGVLAMGCSVGQGLSAMSFLNMGAIFSLISMYLGVLFCYKIKFKL